MVVFDWFFSISTTFWQFVLLAGIVAVIAAAILKFIPFVSTYRLPIQVSGAIAVIISIWFLGAANNEKKWQAKIKAAEERARIAEIEAKNLNEDLKRTTAELEKERDRKSKTITEYIDRWRDRTIIQEVQVPERIRYEQVIKYIEQCPVPRELLEIHNKAARGEEIKK
jgi:hypothetical protein